MSKLWNFTAYLALNVSWQSWIHSWNSILTSQRLRQSRIEYQWLRIMKIIRGSGSGICKNWKRSLSKWFVPQRRNDNYCPLVTALYTWNLRLADFEKSIKSQSVQINILRLNWISRGKGILLKAPLWQKSLKSIGNVFFKAKWNESEPPWWVLFLLGQTSPLKYF